MKNKENTFSYLADTNNEFYKELNNLIFCFLNNDDTTKRRNYETKVQFLLWKLIEDINVSKIYHKNPMTLANF